MRIQIQLQGAGQKPSQGRNTGSIPVGGTTDSSVHQNPKNRFQEIAIAGAFYRAKVDPSTDECEFVRFVGWDYAEAVGYFEDGNGDLHPCGDDEIEIVL